MTDAKGDKPKVFQWKKAPKDPNAMHEVDTALTARERKLANQEEFKTVYVDGVET